MNLGPYSLLEITLFNILEFNLFGPVSEITKITASCCARAMLELVPIMNYRVLARY